MAVVKAKPSSAVCLKAEHAGVGPLSSNEPKLGGQGATYLPGLLRRLSVKVCVKDGVACSGKNFAVTQLMATSQPRHSELCAMGVRAGLFRFLPPGG